MGSVYAVLEAGSDLDAVRTLRNRTELWALVGDTLAEIEAHVEREYGHRDVNERPA